MKITLCASVAFYSQVHEIKDKLISMGHEVKTPIEKVKDKNGKEIHTTEFYKIRKSQQIDQTWVVDRKEEYMKSYFEKIEWADAILVINLDKNNVEGYIGGNTFLEMCVAFYLKKKIFLLNPLPKNELIFEEIIGMKPIILDNDLNKIK